MKVQDVPQEILAALDPEEKVQWIGKPVDRFFSLGGLDFLLIPFGLFFAGFALTFQIQAFTKGSLFPVFFAMPHILVGLYVAFGRLFVSREYRRKMVYVLSDRKAYILSKAFHGRRLLQKPITRSLSVDYAPGREATVRLDPSESSHISRQMNMFWPSHTNGFEFYRISDGEHVIKLLRNAQRALP